MILNPLLTRHWRRWVSGNQRRFRNAWFQRSWKAKVSLVNPKPEAGRRTRSFCQFSKKLIRMVPPKRSSQRRVGNWHIRFMKRQSKLRSSRQNRLSFTITLAERINNGKLKSWAIISRKSWLGLPVGFWIWSGLKHLMFTKFSNLLLMKRIWRWIWDSWMTRMQSHHHCRKICRWWFFQLRFLKSCNHSCTNTWKIQSLKLLRTKQSSAIRSITGWFQRRAVTATKSSTSCWQWGNHT